MNTTQDQVRDAIRRKLHVAVLRPWGKETRWVYRYPVSIDGEIVVMRDSDCGLAKPSMRWTLDEWRTHVKDGGGLLRQVWFWDFAPAEDPAADAIEFCHRSPESAGRELFRLRASAASNS